VLQSTQNDYSRQDEFTHFDTNQYNPYKIKSFLIKKYSICKYINE